MSKVYAARNHPGVKEQQRLDAEHASGSGSGGDKSDKSKAARLDEYEKQRKTLEARLAQVEPECPTHGEVTKQLTELRASYLNFGQGM